MTTARDVFTRAFEGPRDARSREYRAGVLAALQFRFGEAKGLRCPFEVGTAQADAWFAGTDEGHRLARDVTETNDFAARGALRAAP